MYGIHRSASFARYLAILPCRFEFEVIETEAMDRFLEGIRNELVSQKYCPTAARGVEIAKDDGNTVRALSHLTPHELVQVLTSQQGPELQAHSLVFVGLFVFLNRRE